MASAFQTLGVGEGRRLGTPAGDLERQARRLRREGYAREASPLMAQAALMRSQTGGIQSSEAITEKMGIEQQQAEYAVGQQRDEVLGGTTPTTQVSMSPGTSLLRESRLTASPTPRLDASSAPVTPTPPATTGQSMIPEARKSFAQEGAEATRNATLEGRFGPIAKARAEKSGNLEQRQSLFAEMRKAGVKSALDGDFLDRAKALGVDERGFDAALDRLNPETATKAPAAAPPVGRALAQKNIAEKGFQGAAADYFKRSAAEESARQAKSVAYQGSPTTSGTTSSKAKASTATPAAPSMANPVRAAAPTQPTSILSGVNDILVGSEKEEFGGRMDLRPRAQKPREVFSAGTSMEPKLTVNQRADIEKKAAGERERKRISLIDEARQKKRDSLELEGFQGSVAERIYKGLGSGKWSDNPKPPKVDWITPPAQKTQKSSNRLQALIR